MDFADKMLNTTFSDDSSVVSVILKCRKSYGDAKILSWVSAALSLKVQWLYLVFSLTESYTLFTNLSGCTTLVKLILVLDSELSIPDGFHLPNLKTLHLSKLKFNDEDGNVINELIEGCPVLENLCIMQCDFSHYDVLIINCPLLKNLKIVDSWSDSVCELWLDAPNLEVLWYDDFSAWDYAFRSDLKCLRKVHINVGPTQQQLDEAGKDKYRDKDGPWRFDMGVAKLVTACSSTISLDLAEATIDGFEKNDRGFTVFESLLPRAHLFGTAPEEN